MPEQTKITGGKVTYGQTISPKQYESKRADVELTFTVGENDSYEEVFDRASRDVVNRCRVILELPKLPEPAVPKPVVANTGIEIKPVTGGSLFGD